MEFMHVMGSCLIMRAQEEETLLQENHKRSCKINEGLEKCFIWVI